MCLEVVKDCNLMRLRDRNLGRAKLIFGLRISIVPF